jgi:hypothetical protein
MKILLATTFRDLGNKKNKIIQKKFLHSLNNKYASIDLVIRQFGEKKIKGFIKSNYNGKVFFQNKKNLNFKWSHSVLFDYALKIFEKNNYDYVVWCSSDLFFEKEFFKKIDSLKFKENTMLTFFPNLSNYKNSIVEFGIDIFFFSINNVQSKKIRTLLKKYPNYNWGVFENFLFALSDILNMKIINIRKFAKISKFNNYRPINYRQDQINSWQNNQKIFKRMIYENNLSKLYIRGSMYYLAWKMLTLNNLNFELVKIYFLLAIKFIFRNFKINI